MLESYKGENDYREILLLFVAVSDLVLSIYALSAAVQLINLLW